ncbi:MAG TPA: response regulator transcription factor [Woeseiaceae bacterium]|nr:response regulator transcription factor [Woeseiaceae bacterium]
MAERERVAVVIVEDDPAFRARFEQILAPAAGYDVLAAVGSVAEGIDAVRAAPVDLLVVDLGLPDGDGIEVIREVTERQPACAVMVVTVFGDEEHVVSAIEAGASGYLLKDSDPADFTAAVRDLLDGGSPVSPMVARLVLERLRRPAQRPPFEAGGADLVQLSEREAEILTLVAKGFSFADICRLLAITNNTVKTHVNRIYRKLAVHSRGQAVYEAARLGLIDL